MAAPPGQFVALQAFDALKEILSGNRGSLCTKTTNGNSMLT